MSQHSSICCRVLPAAELTTLRPSPFPLHQDVTLLLKLLLPPHPLSWSLSVLLFACIPRLQQVFCKPCATQRSRGHISFRQVGDLRVTIPEQFRGFPSKIPNSGPVPPSILIVFSWKTEHSKPPKCIGDCGDKTVLAWSAGAEDSLSLPGSRGGWSGVKQYCDHKNMETVAKHDTPI